MMRAAINHCGAVDPKSDNVCPMMAPTITRTMPMRTWIAVSAAMAPNLLPIPASGNSSAVCSGVSMVSLSRGSTVISTRWIEKRRAHWLRLEQLVALSGRGSIASLKSTELQELALLYRQAASDLATVREDPAKKQLAVYINTLLARAHNLIYMGRRASRRGIWTFYKDIYPTIFGETFPDTFAA